MKLQHGSRFPVRAAATVLLLLFAFSAGCGDDDPAAPAETPAEVEVFFSLRVDGQGLQLDNPIYTTPAGTTYSVKVLRFIVSDLRLHADDGSSFMVEDVHFYDVADPTTQSIRVTGIPHKNFTHATFTFGLDATRNVRNRYRSNAKLHAVMQWPTSLGAALGYHYMQLEGNYETSPGGPTTGYTTHTGPRQLDGTNPMFPGVVDATAHHFHFPVHAHFTPTHVHEGGHGELTISFDLGAWYADHAPGDGFDSAYDFNALPDPMIMGNLDAQAKLQANGPYCFSASMVSHDGHDH